MKPCGASGLLLLKLCVMSTLFYIVIDCRAEINLAYV